MEGNNSIKSMEMALIIFIAQTGVSTIMLPSIIVREARHDAWISLTFTGLIVMLLCVLNIVLLRRYSDKSIYDIDKLIFGRIVGSVINAFLVLYLLVTTIGGASLFNYFIRITLLQRTPRWVLSPFITLPTFYLVWQGLKSMSRFLFCSLINYFIITLLVFFLIREFRFTFLLPVGEIGINQILLSTKTSFFAFIGFELMVFFYPYISDKNKALKWYLIGNLTSLIFFLIVVTASIAVFGENLLMKLSMPFYNLSRIYNAPVVERVDLYLTALWFIPMACSMRNYVFAAYDGLQKVFKIKKTRISYLSFFGCILIFSTIPKDFNEVLILTEVINTVGLGVSIFIVLCLIASYIRKKGVKVR